MGLTTTTVRPNCFSRLRCADKKLERSCRRRESTQWRRVGGVARGNAEERQYPVYREIDVNNAAAIEPRRISFGIQFMDVSK